MSKEILLTSTRLRPRPEHDPLVAVNLHRHHVICPGAGDLGAHCCRVGVTDTQDRANRRVRAIGRKVGNSDRVLDDGHYSAEAQRCELPSSWKAPGGAAGDIDADGIKGASASGCPDKYRHLRRKMTLLTETAETAICSALCM